MNLEGKRLSAKACVSQIDRMLRPPHSFEVALILGTSEAKGQA